MLVAIANIGDSAKTPFDVRFKLIAKLLANKKLPVFVTNPGVVEK